MTLPGSSETVSSGGVIATHTISGKEYPVQMLAGADGHLIGTKPDYMAFFPPQTNAVGRELGEIFNTDATKVVRVRGIWIMPTMLAVTGAQMVYDINKISTAGTTGLTAVTPRLMDSAATTPGLTNITCGYGSTAGGTLNHLWWQVQHWNEETLAPNAMLAYFNQLPQFGDRICEIILRQNEGVQVKQTTGTVGQTGLLINFALDN